MFPREFTFDNDEDLINKLIDLQQEVNIEEMSKRKNGTNRAAAALGLNPYGWGNGWKKPRKLSNKKDLAAVVGKRR